MYRALGGEAIEVVRILHDAMDLGLVQEQLNRAG
jgi:plasmid stabilization system protein ParE